MTHADKLNPGNLIMFERYVYRVNAVEVTADRVDLSIEDVNDPARYGRLQFDSSTEFEVIEEDQS